jgi:hypothetical protein
MSRASASAACLRLRMVTMAGLRSVAAAGSEPPLMVRDWSARRAAGLRRLGGLHHRHHHHPGCRHCRNEPLKVRPAALGLKCRFGSLRESLLSHPLRWRGDNAARPAPGMACRAKPCGGSTVSRPSECSLRSWSSHARTNKIQANTHRLKLYGGNWQAWRVYAADPGDHG